jgi:hypothetical protein
VGVPAYARSGAVALGGGHRGDQYRFEVIPQLVVVNSESREEIPEIVITISALVGVIMNPAKKSCGLSNVVWNLVPIKHVDPRMLQCCDIL